MKKVLLFAVAAIMVCSASAQNLRQKATPRPVGEKHQMKSDLRMKSGISSAAKLELKKTIFNDQNVKSFKAVKNFKNAGTTRRAIQNSYNGYGVDYLTKASASWKMLNGVNEETGTAAFFDVIPVPAIWASLEHIGVEYNYNASEGTITIPPTCVVVSEDESTYFFIHSWTSNDGSIVFTLNEDGSLDVIPGEDISYSAFDAEIFDLTRASQGGHYLGLVLDIEKVQYLMEGQVLIPTASYQPRGLFLHPGPDVDGSYYSNVLLPAYADVVLENRTLQADKFAWELQELAYDPVEQAFVPAGDPIQSSDVNIQFNTDESIWQPATLIASLGEGVSEPFTWSAGSWFAGGSADDWYEEGTPTVTFSKANPASDLTYIDPTGTKSVICYQGKPAKALYFTGISLFVYKFAQVEGQEFALKCKIHKAHLDETTGKFTLGELIAQSDVDVENIESGTWTLGSTNVRLHWDSFYKEDESGMSEDVNYFLLDEEFAVVFEGWNNGTFTGNPLAFTSYSEGGFSNTYAILPNQETYEGAGWSNPFDVFIGFTDATYGYLQTADDTHMVIPEEGGQAAIKVHPLYSRSTPVEESYTMLFLDDSVEGNEIPDWLQFGFANEDYDETYTFDLVAQADALPSGVEGREATLVFMQPGARLTVTVTQGTVTGINATKASVKVEKTTPMYNLAGQRVNSSFKGLVIKDGKKVVIK